MKKLFATQFLSKDTALALSAEHGTPLFVYSTDALSRQAQQMLTIPAPFGLTIRYAMKANPFTEILRAFQTRGLQIDASSGYEAGLALEVGFAANNILLTSQQLPGNLIKLVEAGVQYTATSLHQLEEYGKNFPGTSVSVRLNPGIGSGHSAKTNVGGPTSSFGIWHEYIPQMLELAKRYRLKVVRLHTHIGSGADPVVWRQAAIASLELIKQLPDARFINLGGGFKIARMDDEKAADMRMIGELLASEINKFFSNTKRKLHLELEPGTFLVANAGILLCRVEDVVDTGSQGYHFLKLNTGMNDILRPSLYGAQHPIAVISEAATYQDYVVVGHNCESGDLLSPAPSQPETLATRRLPEAKVGDLVLIGGVGAYCASMAAKGYNSYPKTKEIVVK